MADGKNIEIKIAATGGEQAAAEVRKVETAAGRLSGANGTGGMKELTTQTGKVTASVGQMRSQVQNTAFQLQDMAVQLEMGTSATRVFSQQIPQLLGGFGAVGAIAGAVIGIGLPMAAALFKVADAAKQSGMSAEEAAEALEKLTEARAKKASEQAAQDYAQFKAALDDETIAYKRQNDEIQRTIDLLQAKRRAQTEVDSADAALALAKIDASDAPEEEKIRARAKVQEDLERKRFEDRKAESGDKVNAAFNRATGATGDATLARSKEEAERQRLAEQEAEAATLRGKINAADQAEKALPKSIAEAEKASLRLSQAKSQGQFGSGQTVSPQAIAELQRKADAALAKRESLSLQSGGASLADRQRLEQLKGTDGRSGDNKALEKSITDLARAAEALEETARKARGDYGNTREIETAKLGGDFEATKRRLEAGKITSGSAAERTAEATRKRQQDDQDRAAKAAANEAERESARLGGFGRQAEGLVPKDAPKEARAAFQKISDGLQNGDQKGEVERLLSLMEQLAAFADKKNNGELVRRIDILEQRIRNK